MYRQTDRTFAGLTQRLLERLATLPGRNIVDIGCGAGELSLALARTRPEAHVLGLDISADLVEAARARSGERDNVRFALGNAALWEPAGPAPDLLVSRHGVMFFDNPVTAFTHLRAIAAPCAGLVFSCFRDQAENAWAREIAALLPEVPPPPAPPLYAPGPFAFADADFVRAILARAGWASITFEAVDYAHVAGQGANALDEAEDYFCRIGPFAAAIRALDPERHAVLRNRLRGMLDRHEADRLVAFPAAAWIVSARNG